MKIAQKVLPLVIAGSMLASFLPQSLGIARAAESGRAEVKAQRTLTAPIIDGHLDDGIWQLNQNLSIVRSEDGADKLDAKMGITWDREYLYVGVQSTDPYLGSSPNVEKDPTNQAGDYWWDHPNISLYIDPTLHQSSPFTGKDVQMGFVYKPGTTTPYFSFGAAGSNDGRDEKNILRAIQTTAEGWNLEVAIPWSFLDMTPEQAKQLGMELVIDSHFVKEDGQLASPSKAWSAYNSQSFWNDTTGYGVVTLDETNPIQGVARDVLLEEDFSSYADGETPFGWISNVNGESPAFTVQNGRLVADANVAGQQSRIFAPVQWDDYVIESTMRFDKVLNSARWASLIFRAPNAGLHPYNQMAIRQSGAFEIALRNAGNGWDVPFKGTSEALTIGEDYTWKVRVVGNNVKEYIKPADADEFKLLIDQNMDSFLLERGKIGFQVDQAALSIANVKVTRIAAQNLDVTLPEEVEALSGAMNGAAQVIYSDGVVSNAANSELKWYSSNNDIVRVVNNELVPLSEGTVEVTATYQNVSATRTVHVTPSLTGKKVVELSYDKSYELANTNEAIDISDWVFAASFSDFTNGEITGKDLLWTVDAADGKVEDGKLTLLRSGMVTVRAQADNAELELLFVVKAKDATKYVLYEEDFSQVANGQLPANWRIVEQATSGAIAVKDGSLFLDATASPARVLLPKSLEPFGDYQIEVTATNVKSNDAGRWHAVMYRVQNENFPYYQMAVRQNATAANGVEFAERTPANGWSVTATGSYSEALQADKMYNYKIITHANRIEQFINDELMTRTSGAQAYKKGSIGFQANGSVMKVSSIKVSLQLEELQKSMEENMVQVVEPETAISIAPTVVASFDGTDKALSFDESKLPATAFFHINKDLQVISKKNGSVVQSIDSAIDSLQGKVIPAFYVHDEQTVDALIAYLKKKDIGDAFVASNQPDLVKQARTEYSFIRGIVDFPELPATLTKEQLMEVRRTTNASNAKIALLPEHAATREQVEYLQGRLITVWAKHQPVASEPSSVAHHKLITSGVNGIVTDKTGTLIDALGMYDKNTTLIRKVWMIGHRGIPALAPENTLEGALLAYEKGADIVENDIYVTKDNQVVIMHDGDIVRTSFGSGNVESFTLEELTKILANKQHTEAFPNARIPSLEQFFAEFKKTDLIHFVEIKTHNPDVIDPLLALIKKYDVEDQVVMISFSPDQIKRVNEKLPGMSNGYLLGGLASDTDIQGSIYRVLNTIQPVNATFNSGYGSFGKGFLEASKHRGITTWPWTYRNITDFTNAFLTGTYGLTTDYNHWASDWANRVSAEKSSHTLLVGESVSPTLEIRKYVGEEQGQGGEILLLSGEEFITVDGGKVTAKKPGTAYVTMRYTEQGEGKPVYDLYTQPIAIEVKAKDAPSSGGGTSPVVVPPVTTEPNTGVIKLPVKVEQGANTASLTKSELDKQLKGIQADASGVKNLKIELQGVDTNKAVSLTLPAAALSQGSQKQQITVQAPFGQVTLPSNYLASSTSGDVLLSIRPVDKSLLSEEVRKQVGSRPAVTFTLEAANHAELVTNGVKAGITVAYTLATGEQSKAHTLVVLSLDEQGRATIVPGAFYDAGVKGLHGNLQQLGTYAIAMADNAAFADLSKHSWAKTPIEALAARAVIKGTGEQRYSPEQAITRADFVTLLVRMLDLKGESQDNFSDVAQDAYYYEALAIAKSMGIIQGQGDGQFKPTSTISREEMFTIVDRAATKLGLLEAGNKANGASTAFGDAGQIAGYAKDSVGKLAALGLIEGSNGRIQPKANATRAETAVFLYRLLQHLYQ